MKKAALHNLGCKVNAYETEAMQQLLEEAGYEIEQADAAPGAQEQSWGCHCSGGLLCAGGRYKCFGRRNCGHRSWE